MRSIYCHHASWGERGHAKDEMEPIREEFALSVVILRSVDLWVRKCVKYRAFLLRCRACSPNVVLWFPLPAPPPSKRHALPHYPKIPPPQYIGPLAFWTQMTVSSSRESHVSGRSKGGVRVCQVRNWRRRRLELCIKREYERMMMQRTRTAAERWRSGGAERRRRASSRKQARTLTHTLAHGPRVAECTDATAPQARRQTAK